MNKEDLITLIEITPDNSPKLLEYLNIAKSNGWNDVVQLIARKLGLVQEEDKKQKKKERSEKTEVMKRVSKKLGKGRVPRTWDCQASFDESVKTLKNAYRELYDRNMMPEEMYVAILIIQLVNASRISEAIQAFKTFVESNQRLISLPAKKHGKPRYFVIPQLIKNRPSYRLIFTASEKTWRERIRKFAEKYFSINTHCLRHTAITHLLDSGVSPEIVRTITGHRNPAILERYVQTNKTLEILEKLSDLF